VVSTPKVDASQFLILRLTSTEDITREDVTKDKEKEKKGHRGFMSGGLYCISLLSGEMHV
jgi:hypothetical protein